MSQPDFAKADSFVRFWDQTTRRWQYLHLVGREAPILYLFRFSELAPGAEQSQPTTFSDLAPDKDSAHVYQAFLALFPETRYKVWHPYNVKRLSLDERVVQVAENQVSFLRYEDSPHDSPVYSLWLDEQRFPAIQPRNVGRDAFNPGIEFQLAKFRVEFDADIGASVKNDLTSGELASSVISFGGES